MNIYRMQQPHLQVNPGAYPPVGLHLPGAKLPNGIPPPPQGLPGLPVALGGSPNLVRPNGLHPAQMMLPTPPPLVSVPHTSGAMIPPPIGIIPPHRLPVATIPGVGLNGSNIVTSVTTLGASVTGSGVRPGFMPPAIASSAAAAAAHSAPATLDTNTHPTQSAGHLPHPATTSIPSSATGSSTQSDNSGGGIPVTNNTSSGGVSNSANSATSGLTRPRSPDRRSESPSAKRARSRSPLQVADESDSDSEPPRSPEPEATILDKECHRSKHAIFVRHLSRGWNSCSRCDIQFRPTSEGHAARSREEKVKALSSQTVKDTGSTPSRAGGGDERRDKAHDEKNMKSESPQSTTSGRSSKPPDTPGYLTSGAAHAHAAHLSAASAHAYSRLSPPPPGSGRPPYPPPHHLSDPTPALRQLSEYARPHVLGEPPRSLPYSVTSLPAHLMADPYYRMAAMYPPGSRERLELELDREKRERDAREREMREKELRDLEIREKMKQEMDMKPQGVPAGFERLLPPGANPMDPYWTELLKRYAAIPPSGAPPGSTPGGAPAPGGPPTPGGGPPNAGPPPPGTSGAVAHHPSQLPGIYPPAHLNSDLIRAERERMERLGEAARAAGNDPLRNANSYYEYFQRISYEQIVLHRQALAQASKSPDPGADQRLAEYARLAQHFARADPLSAGAGHSPPQLPAGYLPGPHALPPGHPFMEAVTRQQEMLYRDLLTRSTYSADPLLTQHLQMSAQQEAARIALERERLAAHGASRPPSHLH